MSCLDKDYPFLLDYFTTCIKNPDKNIAHCILFWGNDIDAQYELATEIARMLNCQLDGKPDCNCRNCNWIKNGTHPAVLTYSKTDNKPPKDETKNVISIEQARSIKENLSVNSDYHRVFILCDRDENGVLGGLNNTNFQDAAINALLKTFEEPPQNTTFIFLTNNLTDLIQTVISRCQCFFVPSKKGEPQNFELVERVMADYLATKRDDVLDFNDNLTELCNNNEPNIIFIQMQNYIVNIMKANLENKPLYLRLLHDINSIEKAKREHKLGMNIQTILETLSFDMILSDVRS